MRASTKHSWSYETLVCGLTGHVTPARFVARLRSEDSGLGIEVAAGRRLARCIRCDAWIDVAPPVAPDRDRLPDLDDLVLVRRGPALRDALVLRLIALDRGIHAVLFGALAGLLIWVDVRYTALQSDASALLDAVNDALSSTGPDASRSFLVRELTSFLNLRQHTLTILALTAVAYCVVESAEAVGLWLERRWAEYLAAIATAGFLPFEVIELARRVTVFRIGALLVNLAILAYLLGQKRLFGLRGGAAADRQREQIDRRAVFGPPTNPLEAQSKDRAS